MRYYQLSVTLIMMFRTIYTSNAFIKVARVSRKHFIFRRGFALPQRCCYSTSSRLYNQENPTLEWKGASHSTSGFVHHYLAGGNHTTTIEEAVQQILTDRRSEGLECTDMSAKELLSFGAIWFLPAHAPRDPSKGGKPIRLTGNSSSSILQDGDYLRIHFSPRRFPQVYDYDWNKAITEERGVIVGENKDRGWLVINKPAMIPVHQTVDNARENVADCLKLARGSDAYISTPQRLDQNTSGLFVVATSKEFAAYFAELLRKKTAKQLEENDHTGSINKMYRCLVCVMASDTESIEDSVDELREYVASTRVMRHFLEPSIRAPKNFERIQKNETWLESLLRIKSVGKVYPIIGSKEGERLSEHLWPAGTPESPSIPTACRAVVELEIELLTGRTHQIRGQLSAEGFPLCGDVNYGGAIPSNPAKTQEYYFTSDCLALQCSDLSFVDPDIVEEDDGVKLRRSDRWNSFSLKESWWTPLLREFDESLKEIVADVRESSKTKAARPDLLPPRVSLSPGKNKYVLIRATHPNTEKEEWFVKSASPSECGGPYHGNVAQDLREWIEAAGYVAEVTGGGRIDYDPSLGRALVYGFSYGFGKGDHQRAASLIAEHSIGEVFATFDNRDGLY